MSEYFRVLIIDDNKEIHKDFHKILTADTSNKSNLETISKQFFGEANEQSNVNAKASQLPILELISAYQGKESLEIVEQAQAKKNPFALAFVDIRMPPGWDGIETIEHIWQVDPDIQMVICTAYSDISWEEMTKRLPKSENLLILKKPFDNVEIRQLVAALTKKWKIQKELKHYISHLEEIVELRTKNLAQTLSLEYAILESTADGILAVDLNHKIIEYNNKYTTMWNIPNLITPLKKDDEINDFIVEQLKDPEEYLAKIRQLYERPEATSLDEILLKDGQVFERYSQPFYIQEKLGGRVWSFRNITEQRRIQKELAAQATHDKLTGIPNRTLILDRIQQAISQANREKTVVGVLFLDLDGFKLINDNFGHQKGDAVLQIIAERLVKNSRGKDSVGRLGGDEFVMVLELSKEENILTPTKKILEVITQPINIDKEEFHLSVSIGISFYPKDGNNSEILLKNADIAMYQAKERGKNNFQLYSEEMNQRIVQRLTIENNLTHALKNKELMLYYQPLFDLQSGKIISLEALVRWNHPKLGIILPEEFIPIAENTGLIIPMGEWILWTACKQNKEWQNQGISPIPISINMTDKQIKQTNLIEMVQRILEEVQLAPQYLEIQIPEKILKEQSPQEAIRKLSQLRKMGIKLSLVNFGRSMKELNHIREYPFDFLKVDSEFVCEVGNDEHYSTVTAAIISMAKNLHLQIIAEGIETEGQLKKLKSDYQETMRGYYASKSLNTESCTKLLLSNFDKPKDN